MYQFPAWKYWLVLIVLGVGVIFALPNVFGEDPAVQLARDDRNPIDSIGAQRLQGILEAASVPAKASYIEDGRLVLRFDTVDEQLKARDAIEEKTGREFVVALTNAARTPALLRRLGLKPMSLGLDLRGGVYFLYEVDVAGAVQQALERMERDFRTVLRDERIPYVSVLADSGAVRVKLRDPAQAEAAAAALRKHEQGVRIDVEEEEANAPVIVARMTPDQMKQRQDFAIQQNITTLRNRVNELGVSEPIVARQGLDRIVVQLPGVHDPNEAIRVLGATATLEFRLVDEANDPYEAERTKRTPIGSKLYHQRNGNPVLLKRDVIAAGDQLTDATAGFAEGQPAVFVKLDGRGAQEMLKTTTENVGRAMAVVFIEKKRLAEGETCQGQRSGTECTEEEVINVATIRGVFSSSFQVTGLQAGEARELALLLRAGSLAAPIYIVEQRTIGPSLGKDNIAKGARAMMIGLALTFVFMAIYYRGFGWIANAVLLANIVLLTALLSMFQASLTLPGIAGVVLTVGMAVDANILIYERIREELRVGNTPQAAINAGFEKAFSAIADANVTTFIAGVVLFTFGTGPIKGFAVVLSLGIATSMFTAILGSRALIHFVWGRRRRLESLPI
jgi:preprotein translocase subunit SecD